MADRYLTKIAGVQTLKEVITESAGAGDAGKIVGLDAAGKLDPTLLPDGVGADTFVGPTTENLTDGNFVDIYDNAGVVSVRKADATTGAKRAWGYVKANVTSPADATVYKLGTGTNSALSGMTKGARQYLSTTAGGRTETAPNADGNLVQFLGIAVSATEISTILEDGCVIDEA